jgi:selenocysteine-specific elongation factor
MARLAQRAELHQIVRDLYLTPEILARAVALVQAIAQAHGGEVTAALFRDATQLGRKRAIQILEYLDRIGLLRRVGDVHRLRSDSTLLDNAVLP